MVCYLVLLRLGGLVRMCVKSEFALLCTSTELMILVIFVLLYSCFPCGHNCFKEGVSITSTRVRWCKGISSSPHGKDPLFFLVCGSF